MEMHPAGPALLREHFTLGHGANWLRALGKIDRWTDACHGTHIEVPLIWPFAWMVLTNDLEAKADPNGPAPIYFVWIEDLDPIIDNPGHLGYRLDSLMFYWWLLDRANIRMLVYSLRKKRRLLRRQGIGKLGGPLNSPWWDKMDLFEEWTETIHGYPEPN